MRHEDPVAIGALAYRRPVTNADVQTLLDFLRPTAGAMAGASTPAFNSRSNGCSSIRISCCACIAIHRACTASDGATA